MASKSVVYTCPHCDKATMSEVHGAVEVDPIDFEEYPFPSQYQLLVCGECAEPSVQWREDFGMGFEMDPPAFKFPQSQRLADDIPLAIRKEFQEAQMCFEAKCYRATLVMVRRVLEGVCQQQLGESKGTLAQNLDKLKTSGQIDGLLSDWADSLRIAGNEGAHFGTEPSHDDAKDALEFGEALLNHIFVLKERFENFKARRAQKPASAEK